MKELDFLWDKGPGPYDPYDVTGKCPEDIRSSWCMNERSPLPDRPEKIVYYLDEVEGGETVASAEDWPAAEECRKNLRRQGVRVVIRPYVENEESRHDDLEFRRWKAQQGLW